MALYAKHKETTFGIGDTIRVVQEVKEGEKTRKQTFEGMVIAIKGRAENKSFTVRRIGAAQIGIERIFPLLSPIIDSIAIVKKGTRGVRRSKLYYTREKPAKEISQIYRREKVRSAAKKKK